MTNKNMSLENKPNALPSFMNDFFVSEYHEEHYGAVVVYTFWAVSNETWCAVEVMSLVLIIFLCHSVLFWLQCQYIKCFHSYGFCQMRIFKTTFWKTLGSGLHSNKSISAQCTVGSRSSDGLILVKGVAILVRWYLNIKITPVSLK